MRFEWLAIEFSGRTFYAGYPAGWGLYIDFRFSLTRRIWSYLREPGSVELWLGRAYVVIDRGLTGAKQEVIPAAL